MPETLPPKEVEITENDSDDGDEAPDLGDVEELMASQNMMGMGSPQQQKQNRNEKKMRKAVAKLGLIPLPEVSRVTMKRSQKLLFVIATPDVYRSASGESFVCFGEAKIEDLSARMRQQEAIAEMQSKMAEQHRLRENMKAGNVSTLASDTADGEDAEEKDEREESGPAGVSETDVKLVMEQASVSRTRAVEALKGANGDIVEAIMNLSSP